MSGWRARMLAQAGLDGCALECGAHWPSNQEATIALARARRIADRHCTTIARESIPASSAPAVISGIDHRGYVGADHPCRRWCAGRWQRSPAPSMARDNRGTDGCSIPTYAVPLRNLAHGFAKMATGKGLAAERAEAAKRLFAACMAEPFFVAGTRPRRHRLMEAAPGRIFVKIGAEGVYCAAVPELGLGIALKCDDGAGRAAEVIVAAVLCEAVCG